MADKAPGAPRGHLVGNGWPAAFYSPDKSQSAIFNNQSEVPEGWHDGSGGKGAAVTPTPAALSAELLAAAKELDDRAQALDDREAMLLERERSVAEHERTIAAYQLANANAAAAPVLAEQALELATVKAASKATKTLKAPVKQPFGAANHDAE